MLLCAIRDTRKMLQCGASRGHSTHTHKNICIYIFFFIFLPVVEEVGNRARVRKCAMQEKIEGGVLEGPLFANGTHDNGGAKVCAAVSALYAYSGGRTGGLVCRAKSFPRRY